MYHINYTIIKKDITETKVVVLYCFHKIHDKFTVTSSASRMGTHFIYENSVYPSYKKCIVTNKMSISVSDKGTD